MAPHQTMIPDTQEPVSRRDFLRWSVTGLLALAAVRLLVRRGGMHMDCNTGCASCHRFSSCEQPAAEKRKMELIKSRRQPPPAPDRS